jgi:hypothetical protein
VLLYLIRPLLWNYFSLNHILLAPMDGGFRGEARTVASLAIILIGLIVVWAGYAKRSRPAWFVMFVIVWFWAFPLFILQIIPLLIRERSTFTFAELLCDAILGPGFQRDVVELHLAFLLMVIGLALPMGRVFVARKADEPVHLPSRRLVGLSVSGAIIAIIVVFFWLRLGILYEIPAAQANSWLVAPPPPPNPYKCSDGT